LVQGHCCQADFKISFTNHRIPHNPFLLLSVREIIVQGQGIDNFIELSFELADTWNG
jgi:hypothetical protein